MSECQISSLLIHTYFKIHCFHFHNFVIYLEKDQALKNVGEGDGFMLCRVIHHKAA